MTRTSRHRLIPLVLLAALAVPNAAFAGGRGGDSGDSSSNPFTGDSYAYFHGGHNLGEQAMILPGRQNGPPPSGVQLYPPQSRPRADATREHAGNAFRPAEPPASTPPDNAPAPR